jgi:hypothetical protein
LEPWSSKETPGVPRAARDLRKGGRDAGLALEERKKIINLERKVTKLEREVAKLKGSPKKSTPKKGTPKRKI